MMIQKKFVFVVAILVLLSACSQNSNEVVEDNKVAEIRPLSTKPIATSTPTNLPAPVQIAMATIMPTETASPQPTTTLPTPTPTTEIVSTALPLSSKVAPITDPTPVRPTDLDAVYKLLEGRWRWRSSTYFFTADGQPNEQTPETTGNQIIFVFGADQFVEEYLNGELVRRDTYTVAQEQTEWLLYMGNEMSWMTVSDVELMISTAPVDGPLSFYSRIEK